MTALVVVGDALLDRDVEGRVERFSPEAPVPVVDLLDEDLRPGGAGLAAMLAAQAGSDVTLVTALGHDRAGTRVRTMLEDQGIEVVDLVLDGVTPQKQRIWAGGQLLVRLDIGDPTDRDRVGRVPGGFGETIRRADVVLVSDYGRGVASAQDVRGILASAAEDLPLVWDPHLRGDHPVAGTWLATPNQREALQAAALSSKGGEELGRVAEAADRLVRRWAVRALSRSHGAIAAR